MEKADMKLEKKGKQRILPMCTSGNGLSGSDLEKDGDHATILRTHERCKGDLCGKGPCNELPRQVPRYLRISFTDLFYIK
jgi:hypothetical protein